MGPITIFQARTIVTMNPSNPVGTHVAVADGRILGVGTLDEMSGWGAHTLDTTFKDHVLVPGFVEAHGHPADGAYWDYTYLGRYDRKGPDGVVRPGCGSVAEVISRLTEAEAALADPATPLIGWGFDPIYFLDSPRMTKADLDAITTTREIHVHHASGHLATVNTFTLTTHGVTAETETEGVVMGADGQPNGELQESAAMMLSKSAMMEIAKKAFDPKTFMNYAAIARNAGHTTVTDLLSLSLLAPQYNDLLLSLTNQPGFPVRFVQYAIPNAAPTAVDAAAMIATYRELQKTETELNRIGGIKLVYDGSIQGFTANVMWPDYFQAEDQGIWTMDVPTFPETVRAFHEANINLHVHCNGDETAQATIEAIEAALMDHAWLNHRHTIQHAQLLNRAQLRRMANDGICANFFTNHLYYWGDQHYSTTVGPERANRMNPAASALREGVKFSFHSDSGVTPTGHLHVMWVAMNRVTPSGRVLGEHERISAYDALQAATLDAAYQIHLDHEIGSIETGKKADFAVLEENPLEVDPMRVKDIAVWGTVLCGEKHPA